MIIKKWSFILFEFLSLIRMLFVVWLVSFSATLGEGNEFAHSLAKFSATNNDTLKIWISPPSQLYLIMWRTLFDV